MTVSTIENIAAQAALIKSGKGKVRPGETVRLSEAASIGDCIRQGDLYITVVAGVPDGYELVDGPGEQDNQLVPGNTQGARHCLDSFDGVELYRPKGWGEDWDSLEGPCIRVSKERTVLHPTHGSVVVPAGFSVACSYQREWDQELRRERRNSD